MRSVLVLLIAVLVMSLGAPVAGAAKPKMKKISAHFVYVTHDPPCSWGIGIDFPSVAGATAYVVKYFDGYYGKLIVTNAPAKAFGSDTAAPKGTLYLGVTGGGYSPPCEVGGDATEGGRFSKGATAFAILGAPKRKVSGTVIAQKCGRTCSRRPAPDVAVVAKPIGPAKGAKGGRTTTDKSGRYRFKLDEGDYEVSLASGKGVPEKQRVVLAKDVGGVDFKICASAGRAQAAEIGMHCYADVTVTVSDLASHPLGGVTVLASNSPLDNDVVELPSSATETTDANGRATFRLSNQKWRIEVASALSSINPPETDFVPIPGATPFEGNPNPTEHYRTEATCRGGSGVKGPNATCDFNLGHAGLAFDSLSMSVRAFVTPIIVTLGSGLGAGTVLINQLVSPMRHVHWHGKGAPRRTLRFELGPSGEWAMAAVAIGSTGTFHVGAIDGCSPGEVVDHPPAETDLPRGNACILDLGTTAAAASFSLPPG